MSGYSVLHQRLGEPLLSFDASDLSQTHRHPLVGLTEFGPFSAATFGGTDPVVRVATIGPVDSRAPLKSVLEELREPAHPIERREYLPPYPGFQKAFHARLWPATEEARLDLADDLDQRLNNAEHPHLVLVQALTDSLTKLAAQRAQFGVIVFHLPERWRPLFTADGFHLHDHVKAYAARLGLTTQILTDDVLGYRCRASVRWRLSTALYAKAGGTPYKLTNGDLLSADIAYLGLAYGIRDAGRETQQFVVCCSQMFDAQGGGLEFIAHETSPDTVATNPLLSRDDMRTVVARSLAVYADRHAGRRPAQLVIHKQIPFTDDESAGAADAWGRAGGLSCLSLTRPAWRAVIVSGREERTGGPRYGYAVDRGTLAQLDDYSALLWVAGNAREATLNGGNYFQGGKGTPRPLLLTRHTGAGTLTEVAAQVLALSKMDWNTDALHSPLPTTITYARVLAGVAKTQNLPSVPYDYRLFI